ncbi:OmpA family protein [Psychrobacter pocilloporae]|uniref:OmpA family protein n=1 Tax=Psychrobacter pocilloporae TaxID=1775882 RepID=A0ABT6IRE3_9GAMM|nr:OmpA family protein [Psychrobacter pocilloporae]MDH4904283.1 OmpA family protein [Psychrobacter pocilloporae]
MKTQLGNAFLILVSALALSACQTSVSQNQATQNINAPVAKVILDSDGDGVPDDIDQCPNTKMESNVVVDDRGCHFIMGPDMSLKIEYRAFFDKDSSELLPKYQDELNNVGKRMQEHKTATIRIEGHSSKSEVDSADLNKSNPLAQARADNVKNYLMSKFNISPKRITVVEYGATRPTAPSDSEEGDMFNRRVYALATEPDK